MKLRTLLTLCMIALGNITYGQFLPPNIDFETGTTSNWEYYTGTCCPIATPSGTLPVAGRHTLTTGATTDYFGGFPIVSPTGGGFSLKLGNSSTGGESEKARYNVNVPTGGGNYRLIYHYAIVLEDPGHSPAGQPRMQIVAYDSATGLALPCDSFYYVSSSSIPGFSTSTVDTNVHYLPWKTGTVNFSGYGGRTVALDFLTGDCDYGGHFAYGYIDMSPGIFRSAITCTTPTVSLYGPAGYSSYTWLDSATFSTSYGTTRNITIPAPAYPITYAVISTPYPGYGCLDTLYVSVLPTVPCSGTPTIGTSYYTSGVNCGDPDTLFATGYSAVCGLVFQWESSPDNVTWTTIPGANINYCPFNHSYASMYYRCTVTCTTSGLSNTSASVYVPPAAGVGLYSVVNPPSIICNGADFYVSTCIPSVSYNMITYYGDGAFDTVALSTSGICHADFTHHYGFPGTYSIRHILYDSWLAVDSCSYSYYYPFCSTLPIRFFFDNNLNCINDTGDWPTSAVITTEVDSAGIAIDTLSSASGFDYVAYGPPGTIYSFRTLATPLGSFTSCPSSGIIYDTIQPYVNLYTPKSFGLYCTGITVSDLSIYPTFQAGPHRGYAHIVVENKSCAPVASTVIVNISPKYAHTHAISSPSYIPAPRSISGTTITWDIPLGPNSTSDIYVTLWNPVGIRDYLPGDTVYSDYTITPITGDINPTDNIVIQIDTVQSSYDPNFIEVSPSTCIATGSVPYDLQYTIHFENTGNDTAHNIYLMDTLSDNVDPRTIEIVMATAQMNVVMMNTDGHNIVKFDFPNIKLLDSSYHGLCDGMVIYKIKTRAGLADGTSILNRAGIYFDINPVVMTNTVENVIGCPLLNVQEVSKEQTMQLYPNPAKDELIVKMNSTMAGTLEVTNQVGQVLIKQPMNGVQAKLNIKSLPAGIYFLSATTTSGKYNSKFTVVK